MIKDTMGYVAQTYDEVQKELTRLVVEKTNVSVWSGKGHRHSFETQLSVNGTIECHATDATRFRVVVSAGTYAYFEAKNVLSVSVKTGGFKDGAVAVIEITF